MKPRILWTIAGFDPSGGAGVTADLMTFAAHNFYGCSAITALTVQSTQGVAQTEPLRPALLADTLAHLHTDLPPEGIKIGMLAGPETMAVIAHFLRSFRRAASAEKLLRACPVVLDPVLCSSSGRELYSVSAIPELRRDLLPLLDFITPNWNELSALTDRPVTSLAEVETAAYELIAEHSRLNVVVTGGDRERPTDLLLTCSGERFQFSGEHVETTSTHGTGCAFSSALLANLVGGTGATEAVAAAKSYVEGALRNAPGLGQGRGPMNLLWNRPKTL